MSRRAPRGRRALLAGVAAAVALGSTLGAPGTAWAWKPKTHVYLAEEAMRDAVDGKVTIYETDYHTGKIVGVLGEFAVDARIQAALKAAPQQFRAGVLGPDAYPDILTGQQVVHPEAAHAVEGGGAAGSNAWLAHLWARGFEQSSSPQVQAFTVGYLTHAAGDVFAHTYVNWFSGGEFALAPDPTNAVKHLILEGYIGKRTPATISATATTVIRTGGPLNPRKREDLGLEPEADPKTTSISRTVGQNDVSISGVEDFIYRELTYAAPKSVLEEKLLKGEGTSRSLPFVFSTLRNGLARDVATYDRERMARSGPARLAYSAANGPAAEYKRAWIADIDDGLKAWPAVSHELAKALVYSDSGSDLPRARAVLDQYVRDHLASMAGTPDALVGTAAFISDVLDAILPDALLEGLRELMRQPLDALIKGVTSKSPEEWGDHLKNPEKHFDAVMNRPGGGHHGENPHQIDLATFNREHLKISDPGYSAPGQTWKIEDLPPAFNTLQLTKLMMLSPAGMDALDAALRARGARLGARTQPNAMLGWVRSLDAGDQWQGPGPQPVFAADGGSAWRKLFLKQIGENDWIAAPSSPAHPDAPAPAAPAQDLTPWAGEWLLTGRDGASMGRVSFAVEADGALRGRILQPDEYGREREGERLELRGGDAPGALVGTWAYGEHKGRVSARLAVDGLSFQAVSENGSSKLEMTGRRKAAGAPPAAPTAPAQPSAPSEPVPPQAPEPALNTPPLAQAGVYHPLEDFDVRLDRAVTARNGSVQVFLTAKNAAAGERYIGAGTFRALMADADGVGVSESQVVRADGEHPQAFDGRPRVPAGGELPVRFVLPPPAVRGRLRTVSIRESDAKALYFDVSGADAAPVLVAPPVGGGAFKALTRFDVRIDRVGRGRDGRPEVFLTLKNTTRAPVTTSKGAIKLSANGADGSPAVTRSALYSVRGERGEELPLLVYLDPGQQARLRYVFESAVSGPITISDGELQQVFAPGGK